MHRSRLAAGLFLALAFLFLSTSGAHAQWVFVARKVLGRVESMTQSQQQSNTPRYDVATVMLEANPDKVYQTVLATVASHKDYKLVQRNDATRNIEVSNGKLSAGVHVVALQDKLSQLVIASVIPPNGPSPTSFAVGNVLRICAEMKVVCTVEAPPPQ
jgi:hypothetical protein